MDALKSALAAKVQKAQKELGRDVETMVKKDGDDGAQATSEALAYAVYDQDVRSR